MFEPGRWLVAEAGVLLSRVLYVKEGGGTALRGAGRRHEQSVAPGALRCLSPILPVAEPPSGAARTAVDVVGPICESTDVFARGRDLPPLAAGDLVVFTGAGAYGAVMASDYNSRPLAAEVLVDGHAVRRGQAAHRAGRALRRRSDLPPWLTTAVLERGAAG